MKRHLLPSLCLVAWLVVGCRPPTTSPELPSPKFTVTPQVATLTTPDLTPTLAQRSTATEAPTAVTGTPTATSTPTEVTRTPTATPDIAKTIVATKRPRLYGSYPSPDRKWQTEVLIYDCARITGEEENAYELLKLIRLDDGVERVADSQLQYCGGLGAAGLAGLFWSPNSRYFYYTSAREGVPEGCGYWERPITRLDAASLSSTYLGGGPRSPDGTKIATWQDRSLVVWDVNGDEIGRVPATVMTAEVGQIAWSPNSQSLVYAQIESYCPFSGKSYIIRLDLPSLKPTMLIESERPSLGNPSWENPDQLRLHDENGKEWRYAFSTKELKLSP